MLLNSGIGQGLFFAGNKHVAIQIIASYGEDKLVTTNPEEILKSAAEEVVYEGEEAPAAPAEEAPAEGDVDLGPMSEDVPEAEVEAPAEQAQENVEYEGEEGAITEEPPVEEPPAEEPPAEEPPAEEPPAV